MIQTIECSECGSAHAPEPIQTTCRECGCALSARYDLSPMRDRFEDGTLRTRAPDMWRYAEVLPQGIPVTLGEGFTRIVPMPALARHLGMRHVMVKDESTNPTGSFKARGMSAAVTAAAARGVTALLAPSAGNAASAMAAYAARAGMSAHVYLPEDCPRINRLDTAILGARITSVTGTIREAGARLLSDLRTGGSNDSLDLSTLKEPYRLDGKKTMGYELFEQLGRLPDAILYPTGGGTGLLGMMKAFDELQDMGIAGPDRPRMIAVQAEGCAPIVRAFEEGLDASLPIQDARTIAAGLCVPKAFADRWILREIRRSRGTAVAVSDDAILVAMLRAARRDGVLLCPEGAALVAALPLLLDRGDLARDDQVILFNTASAYKYPDAMERLAAME